MSSRELTETDRPHVARGGACIVIAAPRAEHLGPCLDSILASGEAAPIIVAGEVGTGEELTARTVETPSGLWHLPAVAGERGGPALTAAVEQALTLLWPADVVLLEEPCGVEDGWLARIRAAAYADTNTASASALADRGTALAVIEDGGLAARGLPGPKAAAPDRQRPLHPRLAAIVGPCVYVRRAALELVGALDSELSLEWALLDLSQRCLLAGLAHVAADDVLVWRPSAGESRGEPPASLSERYPYLGPASPGPGDDWTIEPVADGRVAASSVLPRALQRARRDRGRITVTLDARGLGSAMTGTQRHVLELARALAATGSVSLRALVASETNADTLERLRSLPHTDILSADEIDASTPRSTVFHRPQQVSHASDLFLALRLGERMVLNQLDLIAYRNPGYHRDGDAWREYRRVNRQGLAVADRVVVFSEHTRSELTSDELTVAGRVSVVPPGLDHLSQDGELRPAALGTPGQEGAEHSRRAEFLLCLGADYRHKNRVFALRLLAALRERHGFSGQLVLAGAHVANGSSRQLELDYLGRHPQLRNAVVELGSVSEQERAWLMRAATALVYPTVYEGFGLVPLEAGISGVPCVFAPQSSLAEILPAASATIVPWDPIESAARTHLLLSDPQARAGNVRELAQTAQQMSWAAAAEAIVGIYHEAALAPACEPAALTREQMRRERELAERIEAHDALVARLVGEREQARGEYDRAWEAYQTLKAQTGVGLGLIGPDGALPQDVQRGLLALSGRRALAGPLMGAAAGAFRGARALRRALGGARRRQQ